MNDERDQIDHALKGSLDRLVRHERDAVFTKVLGGVKVGGPSCEEVKKLRKYCEERRFDNAVKAHNMGNKHIDPHELLISSMQW